MFYKNYSIGLSELLKKKTTSDFMHCFKRLLEAPLWKCHSSVGEEKCVQVRFLAQSRYVLCVSCDAQLECITKRCSLNGVYSNGVIWNGSDLPYNTFFDVLRNGHLDEIHIKLDLMTTLRHIGNNNYKL